MTKVFTPLIIDIEASGLGAQGYPIEIGLALEDNRRYSTLIRPAPNWTHWDSEAEKLHRIARDILETYGKPLREVATQLNTLLDGTTLYSDGWVVDKPWLTALFHRAGVEMRFQVSPLEAILSEAQMGRWQHAKNCVLAEANKMRHRASFDAWIVQETYRRTLRDSGR